MFGLPGIGGMGGPLGLLPVYGVLFMINLVLQLFSGNLDGLFNPPDDLN
ncbi:MAG TPA: hypothetical protein VNT79_18085 [Phycisphaerae bacterium]|nr:hypothetical protein [Phycisphaerae bacterium]